MAILSIDVSTTTAIQCRRECEVGQQSECEPYNRHGEHHVNGNGYFKYPCTSAPPSSLIILFVMMGFGFVYQLLKILLLPFVIPFETINGELISCVIPSHFNKIKGIGVVLKFGIALLLLSNAN